MKLDYTLQKCTSDDVKVAIQFKCSSIFENGGNFKKEEKERIETYVSKTILKYLETIKKIVVDDRVIGIVSYKFDGLRIYIDDIFIEKEYRNRNLGREILRSIMKDDICYLWVYKSNEKAIRLYEKMGFVVEEEDEKRLKMKSIEEDMLDYYDLDFTKNQILKWLDEGSEPEFCFQIDEKSYMIIPLKDKVSIQWLGNTVEEYFGRVDELLNANLFDGLNLKRDWDKVTKIWFY